MRALIEEKRSREKENLRKQSLSYFNAWNFVREEIDNYLSLYILSYSSYFDPGIKHGYYAVIILNVDSRKIAPWNADLRDNIEDN